MSESESVSSIEVDSLVSVDMMRVIKTEVSSRQSMSTEQSHCCGREAFLYTLE